MLSGDAYGRGVVHDLANCLLALELNLREEARSNSSQRVATSITCLENAVGLLRHAHTRVENEFQLPAGNFFDPIDVFKQVAQMHSYQLGQAGLKVLYSGRSRPITGSRFSFQRVLTNLLLNSIEAHNRNRQGETGTIYVILRERQDGSVQLSIEDEAGGLVLLNRIEDRPSAQRSKGITGYKVVSDSNATDEAFAANSSISSYTLATSSQDGSDALMDSGYTSKSYGQHGDGLKVVKEIIQREFTGTVNFATAKKGVRVTLSLPAAG